MRSGMMKLLSLVNQENIGKCWELLRRGGVRSLWGRLMSKFASGDMQQYLRHGSIEYADACLQDDCPAGELAGWRSPDGTMGVLFVTHALGGGAEAYLAGVLHGLPLSLIGYVFRLEPDGHTIRLESGCQECALYFDLRAMGQTEFNRLLDLCGIGEIRVNELVSYPLEHMLRLVADSGRRYTYFLHDFYVVCPRYNLLDAAGAYCGAQSDLAVCNRCLSSLCAGWGGLRGDARDIRCWRRLFGAFLEQAAEVTAPSEDTAAIVRGYYPSLSVRVREHVLPVQPLRSFQPEFARMRPLRVALLGGITESKGCGLLYALADRIRRDNLPIVFKVIGYTERQAERWQGLDGILEISGRYDCAQVGELLAAQQVALVWIASVWPETFSYTTSEAMAAGYPVLCFDFGAPAERVRRTGAGWLVPEVSADAVLAQLLYLMQHREEICARAEQTGIEL